ncbi:hypothetical protein Tco_0497512, partial [Tanacetum coccineum]
LFRFGDEYRTNNPILLQQHREKMHKAMKDFSDARAEKTTNRHCHSERRRNIYKYLIFRSTGNSSLEAQVAKLKKASPVPVDIFVWPKHRGQDHFLDDSWIGCYDGKGMHV